MRRNSVEIAGKRGRIKDIKRHTWCNFENFQSMYHHVYEKMVEAGVAIKVDQPLMYDINGNEVRKSDEMYGLPTQYKMVYPIYVLFVDETGKNTNMKTDSAVGGRRLVVPKKSMKVDSGFLGSTSDIHFTVLCFTSACGDAVMCAVIFKSEKQESELPLTLPGLTKLKHFL